MKPIFTFLFVCMASLVTFAQADCANAYPATLGLNAGASITGTDAPAPTNCMWLNGDEFFSWYYFTAQMDTGYTITTDLATNGGLDTRIGVYTGDCGALTCVGSDDDTGLGFLSTVTFSATEGTTYFIVFDTYWGPADLTSPQEFYISEYDAPDPIVGLITFETGVLPGSGYTDCVVDMNGDFLDDVVFVNGTTLTIAKQQTDGTFLAQAYNTGYVENDPSWSIAAGDLDNNGYNDLVYGGGGGASFIWANDDGTGYSETHDNNYIFSQRTNMVDINNDGNLDAFVCHDIDANVFYLNDGNGNLTWNQGGLGENGGNYGSVWIDYDNDCDVDMFIAKCGSDNIDQLHRNNGDGTFTSVGPAAGVNDATQSWSSAWADYDNDGDMDVFIGASSMGSGGHKLYSNNGDGTFTNVTAGSGFDTQTGTSIENMPGDFNNDGWVDVNGAGGIFMINNGDMTFTPSISPFYYAPCGDLNNDGYLDFATGTTAYYNTLEGNNYITINTIGTESNKNGIGARVRLYSAMGTQMRDVRSAESFSTMQSLNTHFGIGTDTEISMIAICWPSGIEDVIYNPQINSTLTVIEGQSVQVEEVETSVFTVYPNPTENVLRLQSSKLNATTMYSVYDMTGALVMSGKPSAQSIDVSSLNAGYYLVEVLTNGEAQRTNFMKF